MVAQVADRALPLVLGFAFLYVIGVLAPRTPPASTAAAMPTVEEIANAVVQKLPKTPAAAAPMPNPAPQPYVNPIHTAVSKWNLASGIRSGILLSNVPADCKITITRLPVTYSEDLAADLKIVLDTIGWKYDERLATTAVEKEMSIRALDANQGPSRECAMTLSGRLQNDGKTRSGGSYGAGVRWLIEKEAPDFLKNCNTACIEITIGNEDPR